MTLRHLVLALALVFATVLTGCDYLRPNGNFIVSPESGVAPLAVTFENRSLPGILPITGYEWDFGDGSPIVTEPAPEHTYEKPGSYTVTLTTRNFLCRDVFKREGIVTIFSGNLDVMVDFSISPAEGQAPLPVSFTDTSKLDSFTVQGWFWQFGDGGTSYLRNPKHTYRQAGDYTVILSVSTEMGTLRRVKSKAVNVFSIEGEAAEGEAPVEGEGETPAEGEGETPAEGEGETPAEGEGETPVEGEGETPAEGEGETPAEGEGETPVEGEGETPAEGEGETPVEGEGETTAEGEGETPIEGEGETPDEGEGETPVEGEGETPAEGETVEGEGEIAVEGEAPLEGEASEEGEGESPSEGETVEGEGETQTEGEGETPVEGEAPIEGEGESAEGETPVEGETPDEGEGETPVEGEEPGEGEGESPSEGETVEGEGETPVEGEEPGEGEASTEGEFVEGEAAEGEVPVEGEGEALVEGETQIEGEGEAPAEGEAPIEGEGESPAEGEALVEGEAPIEGEGETPVEGEAPIEGEGESPAEGEVLVEGEGPVEGEGESTAEGEEEPIYDCPPDTIYAQSATDPGITEYLPAYYLSNDGVRPRVWENLYTASSVYLADTIYDVHWWGVEVDDGGLPCDVALTSFIIDIANKTYTPIRSYTVDVDRTPANFTITVDSVELPVYSYTAMLPSPCTVSNTTPSFINIRKNGSVQPGCSFGWLNTASGGEDMWLDHAAGVTDQPEWIQDNLAFCLTNTGAPQDPGERFAINIKRTAEGDLSYTPGEEVTITLRLEQYGKGDVSALTLKEQLPEGWMYRGMASGNLPDEYPAGGASGELVFSWNTEPEFPFEISYLAMAPVSDEVQLFTGVASYPVLGKTFFSNEVQTRFRRYQTILATDRVIDKKYYASGQVLDVTIPFQRFGMEMPLVLGYVEILPDGWVFKEVVESDGIEPELFPKANATGTLEFAWFSPPPMPGSFTYRVYAPGNAAGLARFHGYGLYRFTDIQFVTARVETVLPRIQGA